MVMEDEVPKVSGCVVLDGRVLSKGESENWMVGERRGQRLKRKFEGFRLGYHVWTAKNDGHGGVDLKVLSSEGKVLLVGESTNWCESSYCHPDDRLRLDGMIANLNEFKGRALRVIWCSFKRNFADRQIAKVENEGIKMIVVGKQD